MERRQLYWYSGIGVALIVVLIIGLLYHAHHKPVARILGSTTATSTSVQKADLSLNVSPEQSGASALPLLSSGAQQGSESAIAAPTQLVPGCSLHFSFQPASKTVEPQGTIQYTATLSNLGEATCDNVSFSVYYASNETFLSASLAPTSSNYYWNIGNLVSNASKVISISTQANSAPGDTEIDNEACATGDNSSDVCPENVIFLGSAPAGATTATVATASVATSAVIQPSSGVWGAAFDSKEFGIWVWETPLQMSSAYATDALNAAEQNGFNTIYLTIDDYVPIAAMADGPAKTAQQNAYFQDVANFVDQANVRGIAVYVEGGSDDWAEPANRWEGYALIDFVQAYNAAYPQAQVRGLQYDVESYLLPEYNTDPTDVLTNFIGFIDEATTKMEIENPNAHFEVVIPHFYDSVIAWTPSIDYGGTNTYTYNHLLQILQRKSGSELVVMAYRNTFSGANGTEALADTEVMQAATGGYTTKVIVAQETGDVEPAYVTFHGLSKADLYSALTQIFSAFGVYSSFGGMAVDYLDPFLVLQ